MQKEPAALPPVASSPPPGAGPHRRSALTILFATLVLISLGGVAVMDFNERWAIYYWLVTTVIFAVASLVVASRGYDRQGARSPHVGRQLAHWSTVMIGVLLVFLIERTEGLAPRTGGLVALLMLGIGSALAGVHLSWRITLLGGLLLLTFVAAVATEQFFWVMLFPMLVVFALLVFKLRRRI